VVFSIGTRGDAAVCLRQALDVREDAIVSFRLAKPGAVIAFDDYLWNDLQRKQSGAARPAIDAFFALYSKKPEGLESSYQVWMRKLTDEPRSHRRAGFDSEEAHLRHL